MIILSFFGLVLLMMRGVPLVLFLMVFFLFFSFFSFFLSLSLLPLFLFLKPTNNNKKKKKMEQPPTNHPTLYTLSTSQIPLILMGIVSIPLLLKLILKQVNMQLNQPQTGLYSLSFPFIFSHFPHINTHPTNNNSTYTWNLLTPLPLFGFDSQITTCGPQATTKKGIYYLLEGVGAVGGEEGVVGVEWRQVSGDMLSCDGLR